MITEITTSELLETWRRQLWPERRSPVELRSALSRRLAIDLNLQSEGWGLLRLGLRNNQAEWAAVSCLQQTANFEWRLRGTWTHPDHRGRGFGRELAEALFTMARGQDAKVVWTLARASAFGFYTRLGFMIECETCQFEGGPHLLMCRAV
jgi:GNAT superfamily N-acetyltransferase